LAGGVIECVDIALRVTTTLPNWIVAAFAEVMTVQSLLPFLGLKNYVTFGGIDSADVPRKFHPFVGTESLMPTGVLNVISPFKERP